jgi:hypothetical protein
MNMRLARTHPDRPVVLPQQRTASQELGVQEVGVEEAVDHVRT